MVRERGPLLLILNNGFGVCPGATQQIILNVGIMMMAIILCSLQMNQLLWGQLKSPCLRAGGNSSPPAFVQGATQVPCLRAGGNSSPPASVQGATQVPCLRAGATQVPCLRAGATQVPLPSCRGNSSPLPPCRGN
uniref:Candidate secreted effector n=1 Tax=Meloidogyne incognita TaxID=6306 RepID=A0A914LVP6_MELIC